MPRNERRRQKSLAHKAAKRKQHKTSMARQSSSGSGRVQLRAAAHWRLEDCLISRDWQQSGDLVQIVVGRVSPDGSMGGSFFLVDLGCLGVKSAFTRYFPLRGEYEEVVDNFRSRQRMKKADLNLVAKVLREAVRYADSLGFKPDPDYYDAMILLGDTDPDACKTEIPLGLDGKPFFVPGPYDNVDRIIAQLEKKVGPGNYHYILSLGSAGDLLEVADLIEGETEEGDLDEAGLEASGLRLLVPDLDEDQPDAAAAAPRWRRWFGSRKE